MSIARQTQLISQERKQLPEIKQPLLINPKNQEIREALAFRIHELLDVLDGGTETLPRSYFKINCLLENEILDIQLKYLRRCLGEEKNEISYNKIKYDNSCALLKTRFKERMAIYSQNYYKQDKLGSKYHEYKTLSAIDKYEDVKSKFKTKFAFEIESKQKVFELYSNWEKRREELKKLEAEGLLRKKIFYLTIDKSPQLKNKIEELKRLLDIVKRSHSINQLTGNLLLFNFLTQTDQQNKLDHKRFSPLDIACYLSDVALAEYLIVRLDVKYSEEINEHPVMIVLRNNNDSTIPFLRLFKLNDQQKIDYLVIAVQCNNIQATKWFLESLPLSASKNTKHFSQIKIAFIEACSLSYSKIIELFIQKEEIGLKKTDYEEGLENVILCADIQKQHERTKCIGIFYNHNISLSKLQANKLETYNQSRKLLSSYFETLSQLHQSDAEFYQEKMVLKPKDTSVIHFTHQPMNFFQDIKSDTDNPDQSYAKSLSLF